MYCAAWMARLTGQRYQERRKRMLSTCARQCRCCMTITDKGFDALNAAFARGVFCSALLSSTHAPANSSDAVSTSCMSHPHLCSLHGGKPPAVSLSVSALSVPRTCLTCTWYHCDVATSSGVGAVLPLQLARISSCMMPARQGGKANQARAVLEMLQAPAAACLIFCRSTAGGYK